MNRNLVSTYPSHMSDTRALIREMLHIINRQEQHLQWMDRVRFQSVMQSQQNMISRSPVSPITQPRNRGSQRAESRPTLADILTAAIMTELGSSMSPVVVRPTTQVIASATETIPFADIESPQYQRCPISHEDFDNNSAVTRIRHCGHFFDPQAIGHWLSTSVRCPVCRHDIRDGVNTSSSYASAASSAASGSESGVGISHTEETFETDEEPSDTTGASNVERTAYINPNDPATLARFMDLVTRDIQSNGGNNTSLHFEFVPSVIDASTLLDGSGGIYDTSGSSNF